MPRIVMALYFATFSSVLVGCSDRGSEERRALLERIEAIQVAQSPADRRPKIQALAGLRLESEALGAVRDLCARGHEALLEAEAEQAAARAGFPEEADPSSLSEAKREEVEAALEKSNAALARASELLPRCDERASALRTPRR